MILISGGTGYIGSHTCVELIQAGYKTLVVDNCSNSYPWIIDRIEQITGVRPEFEQIDLSDREAVLAIFKKYSISGIIHFAAYKAVGESVNEPLKYFRNNLNSQLNLQEACELNGIKPFVFSSSCTVYGEPDQLPVSENSPIKSPESPYGFTKQAGEQMLRDQAKTGSVECILLRYFNPVGAHHSALLGELPIGKPLNLIPVVTQATIGKRGALTVFGNDYPTPDGTCVRDYIHVVDIAKAHVVAVKRLLEHKNASSVEVFNLGTGQGQSVLKILQTFEEVNNIKVPYSIAGRREGDVIAVYADTTHANNVLGWKAELDLKAMLKSAWDWELALSQNKNN